MKTHESDSANENENENKNKNENRKQKSKEEKQKFRKVESKSDCDLMESFSKYSFDVYIIDNKQHL
jgi:hypothetical protein